MSYVIYNKPHLRKIVVTHVSINHAYGGKTTVPHGDFTLHTSTEKVANIGIVIFAKKFGYINIFRKKCVYPHYQN